MMKAKFFFISMLLLFVISCNFSDNNEHKQNSTLVLVKTTYKDGSIKSAIKLSSDSLMQDTCTWYYPNGKVETKAFYNNGKKDGIAYHYYENGKIESVRYYKNDTIDGLADDYYQSGNLNLTCTFSGGRMNGYRLTYYDTNDSILKSDVLFVDDTIVDDAYYYYQNGNIQKYAYLNSGGQLIYVRHYDSLGNCINESGKYLVEVFANIEKEYHIDSVFNIDIRVARPPKVASAVNLLETLGKNTKTIKLKRSEGYFSYNKLFKETGLYKYKIESSSTDSLTKKTKKEFYDFEVNVK